MGDGGGGMLKSELVVLGGRPERIEKGKLSIQVLKKQFLGKCCWIKHCTLLLGTFLFLLFFKHRCIWTFQLIEFIRST